MHSPRKDLIKIGDISRCCSLLLMLQSNECSLYTSSVLYFLQLVSTAIKGLIVFGYVFHAYKNSGDVRRTDEHTFYVQRESEDSITPTLLYGQHKLPLALQNNNCIFSLLSPKKLFPVCKETNFHFSTILRIY